MLSPRYFALSGTLADGRILVAGGDTNSQTPLATAEIYDPGTGTFSATGSLSSRRWDTPIGSRSSRGTSSSWRRQRPGVHDDARDRRGLRSCERQLVDDQRNDDRGRRNPIAVGLANGQVLSRGGYGQISSCTLVRTNALTSAEIYDPSSDAFAATGTPSTPRAAAASALLPTGEAFIVTGEQFGDSPFNTTAEIYDPAMDAGAGGVLVVRSGSRRGRLLVRVRPAEREGPHTAKTERYDAASGVWTQTGDMSLSPWVCIMAELPDGNVLVAAGSDPNGTVLATAEVCNPRAPAGDSDGGTDASADVAADGSVFDAASQ